MKKVYNLLTLILLMALSVPHVWAADDSTSGAMTTSGTQGSFSWSSSKGTGQTNPAINNSKLRLYQKNTLTISSSTKKLSSITLTSTGRSTHQWSAFSASTGTFNSSTYTWTAADQNTTSVTFTNTSTGSGNLQIGGIEVTYVQESTPPDAPTITATAGVSTLSNGDATTSAPTLTLSATGATKYYYTVSTSGTPSEPTTSSTETSGTISGIFTAGNTYYIKAKAYNEAGLSENSTSFSFTYNLPSPPSAPSITGVTNGDNVSSAPNLSVSFPSGADHVYYTIGNGSAPADPTSETNDGSFTSTGTIPASAFTTSGTYYVKVIAKNAGGYSSVSTISFTYNKPANQWLYGDTKTLWKESWDELSAGSSSDQNAPATCSISGAESITYAWSGTTHYIINAILAGGTSPELIFKGTWTVTIPIPAALTLPAELTLTYRSNNTNSSVSATGATLGTVSRDPSSGAGVYTIPVTVAAGATEIIFTFTSSSNTRLEDFLLEASSSSTLDAPVLSGITDGGNISSATDISVSFPTGATHVYYNVGTSSSLADPTAASHDGDLTAAGTIPASTFSSDGTYYVKAVAYDGTNYSSIVTLSFTISTPAPVTGDSYTLLSTQAAFESAVTNGDDIIIAAINNGTPVVLGAFNTNKFDPGDGTYAYDSGTNTIIVSNAGTEKVWTVEGNSTDGYTFKSGSNYLNINTASGSNNVSFPTSSQALVVSISSGNAAIYPSDRGNADRQMYYYTSSSKFGNYTSSGSIGVGLYAKASTTCAVPVVSPNGGSFIGTQAVTITSTTGSTIHYTVYKNNPACDDSEAITQSGTMESGSSFTLTDATGNAAYYVVAYASKSDLDDSALSTPVMFSAAKPATPVLNPGTTDDEGYAISTSTEVTMTCATDGATIYYTTDGSTPTASSTEYSSAITVNSDATYNVVAIKNGVSSDVATYTYVFGVANPVITPPGGTYTSARTVTITCATAGATIYYTTDGTAPSASNGTEYTGSFTVSSDVTVRAIAVYNGQSSEATAQTYVIAEVAETIYTLATSDEEVAAAAAEGKHVVIAMVDSSTKYVMSTTVTSNQFESVTGGFTLSDDKATLSVSDESVMQLTLGGDATNGYTLSYNENYLTPTSTSGTNLTLSTTTATLDITISSNKATIKLNDGSATRAVGFNTSSTKRFGTFATSTMTSAGTWDGSKQNQYYPQLYIESAAVAGKPTISPEAGTYNNDVEITITKTGDGTLFYTLDGSEPGTSVGGSTLAYDPANKPVITTSGTTITVKNVLGTSAKTNSATYVLKAATPNPTALEEFNFTNDFNYKVTSATNGATIYYTTDGSTPSTSSASVASGANIHIDGSFTLRMVAGKAGYEMSDVKVVTFTKELVTAPFFTLAEGTYTDAQKTYIMEETDNATIYYTMTTDGSEPATPDASSTLYVYGGGVNLPIGTIWIKAIATDGQGNFSTITEAHYTCVQGKLHLMPSPSSGNYVDPIQVTIREEHVAGEASVYYTLDGSDPSSSSTAIEYTKGSTITIDHSCTLRIYGEDDQNNYASQASYVIGVLEPEFSPLSGSTITYRGDNNSIEIYTLTRGAKIYYTFTTDGSEPDEPDNTCTLYTGSNTELHGLTAGTESEPNVYRIKAIAYVGNTASTVHDGIYYVKPLTGNGLENVAAMVNHAESSTPLSFENPVQIVFMDRYLNGGDDDPSNDTIQYAYVRDNSGYGQIYFGNPSKGYGAGKTHFEMGDWIDGTQISGPLTVWNQGFPDHMQMSRTDSHGVSWPTTILGHRDIIPESTLIRIINAGTDTDNLWAHYVHLPNLRVDAESLSWSSQRLMGTITSMATGVTGTYYDSFYLHRDKDAAWWNAQPVNRSYDITGLVCYYNQLVPQGYPSNFEIAPITFEFTDNPHITPPGGKKAQALAVTIDFFDDVPEADKDGVSFYYKTSDMEDFELYTGPFTVRSTTTVQAYSSRISPLTGDELRSVITSETYEFENVEAPVISPASQTFQASSPVNVTISCETGNATIWYTTDGTNPLSASGTRQKYIPGETVITVTSNTTVRAIATHGSVSSVEADARTYTLVKNNGVEYELVTSASQLIPGRAYVIVNRANNVALNITQTEINRRAVAVTLVDDGNKVQVNDDVAVFTLGGSQGAYTFFTENGADAAANGYLYTQTMTNTLLTRAAVGSDGFAEADITIDATTHDASIEFGGANRYLYYYKRDNLFSTYNKSTQLPVALYWRAVTDLADIVNNGTVGEQYVVNDDLVGVFVPAGDPDVLYAKDFNKSRHPSVNEHGAKDYIGEVMGGTAAENYDQSTWVKIVGLADPSSYEGKTIVGGTLVVTLTDKVNPTITKTTESSEPSPGEEAKFSHQTYVPASFMGEYMTAGHGIEYFFVVPKPQEYVQITAAVYDGTKFIVPESSDDENKAELTGGFDVDWTLMSVPGSLQAGNEYDLEGIVEAKTGGGAGARRKAMSASSTLKLVPTRIDTSGTITGIDGVSASRKAVRTRYYNISGMESDKPFQGVVNIIVVTYDDGSTFSRKVLF